jgi:hypothetical protein
MVYDENHNTDGNKYTNDLELYGHDGCKYNIWSEWFHGTPWRWIQCESNMVEWTPDTHSHLYLSGEYSQATLSTVPRGTIDWTLRTGATNGTSQTWEDKPKRSICRVQERLLGTGSEFHDDMILMDYCLIMY